MDSINVMSRYVDVVFPPTATTQIFLEPGWKNLQTDQPTNQPTNQTTPTKPTKPKRTNYKPTPNSATNNSSPHDTC